MTAATTILRHALLVDFTGKTEGFKSVWACLPDFADLVRSDKDTRPIVLLDVAVGANLTEPVVVRDHLNLSGNNPLLGPNHEAGERFPVVQGIYIEDALPSLRKVVAVGVKPGLKPTAADMELIAQYGGEICCYNAVPAMLVAAHAKRRVLAILLPNREALPEPIRTQIMAMVEAV